MIARPWHLLFDVVCQIGWLIGVYTCLFNTRGLCFTANKNEEWDKEGRKDLGISSGIIIGSFSTEANWNLEVLVSREEIMNLCLHT
jgi:hypothetical protein